MASVQVASSSAHPASYCWGGGGGRWKWGCGGETPESGDPDLSHYSQEAQPRALHPIEHQIMACRITKQNGWQRGTDLLILLEFLFKKNIPFVG